MSQQGSEWDNGGRMQNTPGATWEGRRSSAMDIIPTSTGMSGQNETFAHKSAPPLRDPKRLVARFECPERPSVCDSVSLGANPFRLAESVSFLALQVNANFCRPREVKARRCQKRSGGARFIGPFLRIRDGPSAAAGAHPF